MVMPMKNKLRILIIIISIVSACSIAMASYFFVVTTQSLLRDRSVTDILEVTSQGKHALDTYINKDFDTLHQLVNILKNIDGNDRESIQSALYVFDDDETDYLCMNEQSGFINSDQQLEKAQMNEEQRQRLLQMKDTGIREPYIDEVSGVRKIAVYERFTFRDGSTGIAQKSKKVADVRDRFTLSFYDNTGFSYIVNADGDVLIRSTHHNSNRTFQNLFDIIDLEGNDAEKVTQFQKMFKERKSGAAQFLYQDEEYIFCFVPMDTVNNWYVVSIIPAAEVMEQADTIIRRAISLCLLIMVLLAVIGYFFRFNNRKHRQIVENLAFYDELTGLYRYEKFLIEGEHKLQLHHGHLALLYIDIIGFKLLNDMEGYGYGDRVLVHLSQTLKQMAGHDDILCRETADDFIMLVTYQDIKEVEAMAEHILQTVQSGIHENRRINIRIGICLYDDMNSTVKIPALVDRARMAQKYIKSDAQNTYKFYDQTMRTTLLRDAQIEQQMEQALKDHEFFYVIQPKYQLDGTKIRGGEALVRWCRDGRIISPGEFIPLFERNGFIRRLDEYIYESVCQDIHQRLQQHEEVVPISVNVSRVHLYWDDFVDTYARIKREYEIPDGIIELELTESGLLDNIQKVLPIIQELHKQGFVLSIDDFGSGYSSLNTLKDLPVDVVKVDRAFFDLNDHDERNRIILRSMIAMAKQLSMKVVAEGIENSEQLCMIEHTGCDMVQGFIYSKPVDKQEFYRQLHMKRK